MVAVIMSVEERGENGEDDVGFSYIAAYPEPHRNGRMVLDCPWTEDKISGTSSKYSSHLKRSLMEFSRSTTFHGLRYIVDSDFAIRRLMWIVVVLACIGGVGYQIIDRILYFSLLPVNVNVQINYNQTLIFPALTVCNQNAFKASQAASRGYYRLIEDMYSQTDKFSSMDLRQYGAENITLDKLFMPLRHQKEDLIVKCEWDNEHCSPSDFDVIVTDHGVCYRFKSNHSRLLISSSGVDSGLRLTLNVEQYEYMTGPHDAAGVKILLHDSNEFPSVHGLGQAIPTGSHAFIGVKYMVINNLPKPYGRCDYRKLRHTHQYTAEECFRDCMTDMAANTCGCRDADMPSIGGYPPVCTLEQYYGCFQQFNNKFHDTLKQKCDCPVPCEFSLYDTSLSYATISNHVVSKLLTSNESQVLYNKLLTASEVTSRMDRDKFDRIKSLVENLERGYSLVQTIITRIAENLKSQINISKGIFDHMGAVFASKERLYRFQEYTIENNFLRGREAMEERTLRNIVIAYAEVAMMTRRRIRRLATLPANMSVERESLYDFIVDEIKTRQEIAALARENISLLLNAYYNGTKIFNYKFENISRKHNPYIIPKPLLLYSMTHNWYVRKYCPKMMDDLHLYHNVTEMFLGLATLAYENGTVNETTLNYVFERFQFSCRTFMFSKSVCYKQGIELPLKVLKKRHSDFNTIWNNYNVQANGVVQNLNSLNNSLRTLDKITNRGYGNLIRKASNYLHDNSSSLIGLASEFLNEGSFNMTRDLKDFFQEVRTRGQIVFDAWSLLVQPSIQLWTMVIDDEDMVEYFDYTNNTEFLRNLTEVVDEVKLAYINVRDENDVRSPVENKDGDFFDAVDDLTAYLETYKNTIKIDSNFVKENFLQLNVFYRQLSYEQIDQQVAYDIFALICDIGGAMGLFIGASMLTVVEIIDLILTQTALFASGNKHKQRQ